MCTLCQTETVLEMKAPSSMRPTHFASRCRVRGLELQLLQQVLQIRSFAGSEYVCMRPLIEDEKQLSDLVACFLEMCA